MSLPFSDDKHTYIPDISHDFEDAVLVGTAVGLVDVLVEGLGSRIECGPAGRVAFRGLANRALTDLHGAIVVDDTEVSLKAVEVGYLHHLAAVGAVVAASPVCSSALACCWLVWERRGGHIQGKKRFANNRLP